MTGKFEKSAIPYVNVGIVEKWKNSWKGCLCKERMLSGYINVPKMTGWYTFRRTMKVLKFSSFKIYQWLYF